MKEQDWSDTNLKLNLDISLMTKYSTYSYFSSKNSLMINSIIDFGVIHKLIGLKNSFTIFCKRIKWLMSKILFSLSPSHLHAFFSPDSLLNVYSYK